MQYQRITEMAAEIERHEGRYKHHKTTFYSYFDILGELQIYFYPQLGRSQSTVYTGTRKRIYKQFVS